jgi:hypothetical protein
MPEALDKVDELIGQEDVVQYTESPQLNDRC